MGSSGARPPWTDPADEGLQASDAGDEYDVPTEVDATFRTLRRVALGHFVVFLGVLVTVPVLTLTVDWWSEGRMLGGMAPGFVMAAIGLYVFFFLLAVAAATLSNAVEDRMLGDPDSDHREARHDDGDLP